MGSLHLDQLVPDASATPGNGACYFDAQLAYTLASAATQVVPIGAYFLQAVANISVQIQVDSTGTNWQTFIAAGAGGLICSDGTNVRILATNAATALLMPKAPGP